MFEPKCDQTLGKAQRDEALSGCARDLKHLGDFVLRMTGDKVEPAGTRGFVQT
jgi:hypothetical protein